MEIQSFFFKLVLYLHLFLAVYLQTSLQQQPYDCNNGKTHCNNIASAPGVSLAVDLGSSLAPAPSLTPQQQRLAPEDVVVLQGLLEGLEKITKRSVPDTVCFDGTLSQDSIQCDCHFQNHTICRVTKLSLSDQKNEGSIPKEIGALSYLQNLDLSGNMLRGTIPDSFWNLSNLKYIDLSYNNLEGPIPSIFHNMKSLKELDLSVNSFKGRIPSQLGTLGFLEYLKLDRNKLSGEIPKELGNITSLSFLSLSDNMLNGEIPRELGNLVNLSYLQLRERRMLQLTG